jgi:hypothetical protein
MDPALCGMWKYCFHLRLQAQGLRLVNETQVMVVAHLYNALKQNGYLPDDCVWKDVEYLLKIHEQANTFLSERPKAIGECTKRLALAQGVSLQTFAAGRRQGAGSRLVLSKSGGKILRRSTPIATVFVDRFLQGGSSELSLANVETILARSMDGISKELAKRHESGSNGAREHTEGQSVTNGDAHDGDSSGWEDVEDNDNGGDNGTDIYDDTLNQWNATRTMPAVGFLYVLTAALEAEHLDLQFDYFSFHRQTRLLLEQIHTACYDYGKTWIKEEMWEALAGPEGPFIMPGVIMLAASSPAKAQNLYALKDTAVIDTRGLKAAAAVMKEFIEREGAVYSDKELSQLDLRQKMGEREHGDDWETTVDELLANAGLTGAVGRVDGLTLEDSARQLKAVTAEQKFAEYKASLAKSRKTAQSAKK